MKLEINIPDEEIKRIKEIRDTRKKLVDLFNSLKDEPKNNEQLAKINETIKAGDDEQNYLLLKGVYENKLWQGET
jgi:hypothetical protein